MSQLPGDDKQERPTREDEALSKQFGGCDESILEQARRRKAASRRMPPLADGRRDPWQFRPRDGAA